jgi:hypothetical protein
MDMKSSFIHRHIEEEIYVEYHRFFHMILPWYTNFENPFMASNSVGYTDHTYRGVNECGALFPKLPLHKTP